MFRERRHSHKASFWLGSGWVSSMQLFKMLAWSTVNPSKHTTRLKRTLFGKSHQFRALTKKEEKRAAVLNFSCFKISLKRKKKLTWQRPYILGSIATSGQLCFILERWRKPAGARAGETTRPLDLLSTDILAPGPGHACPEAPLQLCCAGESVQRLWQLIFSFEIRIHVGYFKVWPGIGVGRRGPLGVIWPLGTVFWFFRLFEFQKWRRIHDEDTW